ncbi:hypothetical protein [Halorhodospira halochloris]|uniref:hypothetical protein n=1 Tax=Halorhodospira halochloris TaxID=1052 RepID=UPI001EE7AF92|nr:hypothetical protein [Halorhodospira halochloris]MCG5549173.1 hypothetical protein [Halorhodospira halochloris]
MYRGGEIEASNDPTHGGIDPAIVIAAAAVGTDVSPDLVRAALTAADLVEIEQGRETAETLHGFARALPHTPELMEQAKRRLAAWTAAQIEEAVTERVAIVEEATGAGALEVERTARAFYNHLFGGAGCCKARSDFYCQEGARLKAAYEAAAAACDATMAERVQAKAQLSRERQRQSGPTP